MTIRSEAAVLAAGTVLAGSVLGLAAVAELLPDDDGASQRDEVGPSPSVPVEPGLSTAETPSPEVSVEVRIRPGLTESEYQELAPQPRAGDRG